MQPVKPRLSRSAIQLREQIDDAFPDRDRTSDGWIGDARHALRKSDHVPDGLGWVRALDIDRDLSGKKGKPDLMPNLADQIRALAKSGDKRIAYIIFDGKIASPRKAWRWRPYDGINKHNHHAHISFTTKGDEDSTWFNIPMIGGTA